MTVVGKPAGLPRSPRLMTRLLVARLAAMTGVAVLAAAGAVVTALAAVACSCASEPSDVTSATRAGAVVFSGVLVGRDEPRGLAWGSADGARLTFEVDRVYLRPDGRCAGGADRHHRRLLRVGDEG